MTDDSPPSPFHVYILRCNNGAYYLGYSKNPAERVSEHNEGRGAKYTFQNRPIHLVYIEPHATESSAMQRERQVKKWTRTKKEALIAGGIARLKALARR